MRRIFATLTALTLAGTTVFAAVPATAAETDLGDLTVFATTDIHGHAVDYDYFTGTAYGATDPARALGMDHLSTALKQVRAEQGAESVLTLDNGDANQGSSLQTYYQNHRTGDSTDPMASVFNLLEYDAGVVGNHEYNYGLDALKQYQSSLNMQLLGANVIDESTQQPALAPYTMIEKTVGGKTVKIGVIGVVTPGVETWDKAFVEGKLRFEDTAQAVNRYAPQVKAEGADVVVVLAHTGLDAPGYIYNAADKNENIAKSIAEQSTDVDVVIGGHSHVTDKLQEYFTNKDGEQVLYSQPGYWARFASQITIPLTLNEQSGAIEVEWSASERPTAKALKASEFAADPAVLAAIEPYHSQTSQWVNTVVATATETMPAADSAWKDTAILDFINKVQTDEVTRALAGSEYQNLPILAEASPFSRTAVFSKGDVTIADMAGLYIYDNTLYAVKLNGAQLKDYLEWSARYYIQQEEGAQISDWASVTNAIYDGATRGIPDYSYDVLSGVNYHINISQPAGQRIENLTLADGSELTDSTEVVLALNNYRWSGGSGYPHVSAAPIVYNEQKAVRDLMIDWAIENKTIDPAQFFVENWSVSTSSKITPAPEPTPEPSLEPTPAPTQQPTLAPSAEPSPSAPVNAEPTSTLPPAGSGSDSGKQDGAPAKTAQDQGKSLAHTGANLLTVGAIALVLMLVGGLALLTARRSS